MWNPNSVHREVYPLASMPMSLGKEKVADETLIRAGNVEPGMAF
jgi:hypothetical protein